MTERFEFELDGERLSARQYPARRPIGATLLFGHGASGGQESPFVVDYATALSDRGLLVVTYDFPFVVHGRRAPDRYEVLAAAFRAAVRAAWECRPSNHLFVGGKSLGGRIATHALADGQDGLEAIEGIVVLGYPLHPISRPDAAHSQHLQRLPVPALFVQGTRDVFGGVDELRRTVGATLPDGSEIFPIEGADHSLVVRGQDHTGDVSDEVVRWISENVAAAETTARPRTRPGRPRGVGAGGL